MKRTAIKKRVGLSRALSKLGFCSRSEAARLIRAGRVTVNGHIREDPAWWVDIARDQIRVDSQELAAAEQVYLMLNKPRGLVTTASDERGRRTVYDCIDEPNLPWYFPVGRLDKASEGLLLLTNDTVWAARIQDPGSHLKKRYHVQVNRLVDTLLLHQLVDGVNDDGENLKAVEARLLRHGKRNSWIEVVLDEGKNRQIRRMLNALDTGVLRLVRVAIGPLVLGDLPKGAFRNLTKGERDCLGL